MKAINKCLLSFIVFSGLFFYSGVFAAEKIDNYAVKIEINPDASIDVSETIAYDFGNTPRHGIFRTIPVKYKARGGNYNLRISNISVADENGISYNFQKSTKGDNVEIKIGDADKYVTGRKVYNIDYKIKRAINYFDDHDELYWNAIGTEWFLPVNNPYVQVALPENSNIQEVQKECFVGVFGSTEKCAIQEYISESHTAVFKSRNLNSTEGVTIVVGFPKEIVARPGLLQLSMDILQDNWVLALPVITLIILLYLWYTRGRDPKGRGTIIAQYDAPDNLTPAEVGTLIDIDAENKDISADIINLAIRGYIKITRIKDKGIIFNSDDYLLEKLKSEDDLQNDFEKNLIKDLFHMDIDLLGKIKASDETGKMIVRNSLSTQSVKLSDLKNKFFKSLEDLKENIYNTLVNKGYFHENPKTIKLIYGSIGSSIIIGSIVLGLTFSESISAMMIISLFISGIFIATFSLIMPARTKKGAMAREYILGLKKYLSVAEKARIKFHNAPEKNPEHFEKLLPYAMVLGVEKEWARKFERIYMQNPNWYSDPSGANFNSTLFVHNLNKFSLFADSNLSSQPGGAAGGGSGFGGGGFGGGGFGGGGGGSW